MAGLFDELGVTEEDIQTSKPSMFDELGITNEDFPEPTGFTPMTELPTEVQEDVEFTQAQHEQLALSVFSESELSDIKSKGKIGFFEAKDFLDYEDVLPGGGIYKAVETAQLLKAVEKVKNGEETSIGEDDLVRTYIRDTVEQNTRGFSVRGKIAHIGSQLPAFLVEFAATAGIGKVAQKASEKAVGKLVQKTVLAKATGIAANVAARTAVMPAQYAPKYAEERLNNFTAVTDKGSILWKEGTDSPAKSALKAFAYTGIEVGSEMSGVALGKYIVKPVGNAIGKFGGAYLRTPVSSGIQKIPANIRHAVHTAYQKIQPNAKVSKVFTTLGWNGMIEELGEERVAAILTETLDLSLDKEMTFDDWLNGITPSGEDLLVEAGLISIMGGAKGSVNLMTNMLVQDKGITEAEAQETVDNLSESERDAYIQENLTVRSENESIEAVPDGVVIDKELQEAPDINNDESGFQEAYREWVNDLQPVENVVKVAKEAGADINNSNDPGQFARIYRGVMSNIHYNVRNNTTRINPETGTPEVTGKGLEAILTDFDAVGSTIEPNKELRREDAAKYRIALSILDDVELSKTDVTITISPEQESQARQDIEDTKGKYGEEIIFMDNFAKETTEYSQRILLNLVDSGLLTQEQYDEFIENRPNFTSLKRVFEDSESVSDTSNRNKAFSDVDSSLRKRRGSDREIEDVDKTLINNTARILDAASRNRVAQQMANLTEYVPEYIQKVPAPMKKITLDDGSVTYRPTGQAPAGTITAYFDGKPQYFKVSKPILKAMEGLQPEVLEGSLKVVPMLGRALTNLVKLGSTTLNPDFIVRNLPRDIQTYLINSQGKATPLDAIKGIGYQLFQTKEYKDWLKDGGAFDSFMELSNEGFGKALKEIYNPKNPLKSNLNPYNLIVNINTLLEQAPRVGVAAKLRKEGMDGLEAALYTRDMMDFSRGGSVGKRFNKYFAFLNAGIQGVDKLARTMKEHPKAVIGFGVSTVTLPSVLLTGFYLYGDDEETRQEYLEIPQWQRDLFWVYKTESGWKRHPKPFSYGFLFGSMPERMMVANYGSNNPESAIQEADWKELATGILGSVSPVYLDEGSIFPTAIKPLIEVGFNYNTFTDRAIYPEWMDDLEPILRKKDSTSQTSQSLVELLKETTGVEISPANLDHLIQGYTSSIGRNILGASDMALKAIREAQGEDIAEKPITPSDVPVLRAVSVRDPVGSASQSLSNFYDNYFKLRQTHRSYKYKLNNGTIEEAQEYEDDNFDTIMLFEEVDDMFYEQIRELNKESKDIYSDTDMTGDEKVQELHEVNKLVTEIARDANNYIKENKEK
jgi:hypothetical protein